MSFTLSQETLMVVGSVLGIYFAVIMFIGIYFSRFSSNINDFFYSGQRLSWWLPVASLVATGIGAYSYMKYSEQGFTTGLSSTHIYFNDWFFFPVLIFAWIPILYFNKIKSIPEYFEKRYNSTARYLSVFIILAYIFFYIGFNLFTLGVAVQGFFDIPMYISIPLLASLLGVYVSLGGQTAVIFTDVFQGLMLYLLGLLVIGYGLYTLGGLEEFWGYLPKTHRVPLAPFNSNTSYNTVGIFWADSLVASVAFIYMNQGFLMRFLTTRNVQHARVTALFNILITVPLSALFIGATGWIAKSIISKQTALNLIGPDTLEIVNSHHTFFEAAYFVIQGNPWIMGFVFAAIIAALMSTVDSLVNAATAIGIYDIYKPLIRPQASDRHYLRVARIFSSIVVLMGVLLVMWFSHQQGTLMAIHYKGIMLIIPPVVTTIFLGLFWKNFHALSACVAMCMGVLCMWVTIFYPEPVYWMREFLLGLASGGKIVYFRAPFGVLFTAMTGVICQWYVPRSKIIALKKTLESRKSSKISMEDLSTLQIIQYKLSKIKDRLLLLFVQGVDKKVDGLTANTLAKAMFIYKGNKTPNLKKGQNVKDLTLVVDSSLNKEELTLSQSVCDQMCAEVGDRIYLSDQRWYLGGLRSGHFELKKIHSGLDSEAYLSADGQKFSYLISGKKVFVEKTI